MYEDKELTPWREVFAFLPVTTMAGERVWLKNVYRREALEYGDSRLYHGPEIIYGTIFDVLKEQYD
jgi:hypothetical protein